MLINDLYFLYLHNIFAYITGYYVSFYIMWEQTGNRLICPGMSNVLSNGNRGARVTEVDPETQDVVFELELEDAIYQRVYRMSLYPENQ